MQNSPNIGRKYRATMSDYANEVRANLIVERHLVAPILDADIGRIHFRSWEKLVTDGIP